VSFPSCSTHDVEQRSPEWLALRLGVLTASEMGVWLAERAKVRLTIAQMKDVLDSFGIVAPKGVKHSDLVELLPDSKRYETLTDKTSKARERVIAQKLAQVAGCEGPPDMEIDPDGPPPKNPSLWAIWNGIRLEKEARERFAEMEGSEVEVVGFCLHESGRFGCSPDGAVIGGNPESARFIEDGLEIKCPLPETHVRYLLEGALPDDYRAQVHGSMAVTGAHAWHFFSYCPGLPPLKLRIERDQFTEDMLSGLNEFAAEMDKQQERIAEMWDKAFGKEPRS